MILVEYNFHEFYTNEMSSQDLHTLLQQNDYIFVDFMRKNMPSEMRQS